MAVRKLFDIGLGLVLSLLFPASATLVVFDLTAEMPSYIETVRSRKRAIQV